jgi:outer membrane lipoprotein-sorting protein
MEDWHDSEVDRLLRQAYSRERPRRQFDDWKKANPDAVAYLNPVVTKSYFAQRRLLRRVASIAIAASLLLLVGSFMLLQNDRTFAATVRELRQAKTMSWEVTTFLRCYGEEPDQTWLSSVRSKYEYEEPGLFRITFFDEEDRVEAIEVIDVFARRHMRFDLQTKTVSVDERLFVLIELPPLQSLMKSLSSRELEYLGIKTVEGRKAHAFRHERTEHGQIMELWVDEENKQLIGASVSSSNSFDPFTVSSLGNPSGKTRQRAELVGNVWGDIRINPALDEAAFSFKNARNYDQPNESAPSVFSENEFVQFLALACKANGSVFLDSVEALEVELYNQIEGMAREDRTEDQAEFHRQFFQNVVKGNIDPINRYIEQHQLGDSFRYFGKGVRLGQQRIVCCYRLPGASDYRAIYGDLQIRNLAASELPLPVE